MARSNTAPRRPPVPELPSSPAGGTGGPYGDVSELLGVVVEHERRRGRGAQTNASGRYEPLARIAFDDGWRSLDELPPFKTTVQADATRKIITRNESPDIGFDRSINPYRGCEHGCIYCFARPTHAFLGLSPGLDFESKLFVKPEAAELLEKELSAPGYEPKVIAIGTNTDPYQPIERRYKVMRRILEVLDRANHPVGIVTKSALVLRDLDAATAAGVKEAGYVLLRLPLEVRDLFREWLMANYPDRASHVFKLIRETRGGKDYDSTWGKRMKGTGPYAWMIGRRFELACDKLGLNASKFSLSIGDFRAPKPAIEQLNLFAS